MQLLGMRRAASSWLGRHATLLAAAKMSKNVSRSIAHQHLFVAVQLVGRGIHQLREWVEWYPGLSGGFQVVRCWIKATGRPAPPGSASS